MLRIPWGMGEKKEKEKKREKKTTYCSVIGDSILQIPMCEEFRKK